MGACLELGKAKIWVSRDFGEYWVVGCPQKCRSPGSLQIENRDHGWIDLGLEMPKSLVWANKRRFLDIVLPFPIIWGFPLGGASTVFFILVAPVVSMGMGYYQIDL